MSREIIENFIKEINENGEINHAYPMLFGKHEQIVEKYFKLSEMSENELNKFLDSTSKFFAEIEKELSNAEAGISKEYMLVSDIHTALVTYIETLMVMAF